MSGLTEEAGGLSSFPAGYGGGHPISSVLGVTRAFPLSQDILSLAEERIYGGRVEFLTKCIVLRCDSDMHLSEQYVYLEGMQPHEVS